MPGEHLLDRYTVSADPVLDTVSVECAACATDVAVIVVAWWSIPKDGEPALSELVREALAHEIKYHPAEARGNNA